MNTPFKTTILAALAATLTGPAYASEVNVYSSRQPFLVKPLFDAFTTETGIDVNVSFLKKGMAEKLKAEGKRSPADLVMTTDISRLNGIVEAGVAQAVQSSTLDKNIPAAYRDPTGQWFGLTSRARVVYASKTRVKDGEVTTYEALTDPKWQGRICIRSGTNAYNLALTSAVIAHHGQSGAKTWLQGIKANLARKPSGNDRAQIKAIFAGQCDISIGNTYYMKKMLDDPDQVAWANSVRIIFPTFENGGTHVNISGMALTKAAHHRGAAIRLMEWLSSKPAQEIYAEVNGEYPLNPASKPSALVASWGRFTPDTKPLIEIARLRPTALKITEEVNFDE